MAKKRLERKTDIRIEITKRVFGEYARRFHINKGTVFDGWIDSEGNFRFLQTKNKFRYVDPDSENEETIIFPGYYKVIGRFYLRKVK